MTTYRDRQVEQLHRWQAWKQEQGGWELPVTLDTLLRPEQQARIAWLKKHAVGKMLEVGCSWGYVLACLNGHTGVDVMLSNIELARLLSPGRTFEVADARGLPFKDDSFGTVVCPEILEHLEWPQDVFKACREAQRVAARRVLITIPDGRTDSEEALCKKHAWLLDAIHLGSLLSMFAPQLARVEYLPGFACIEWNKE